MGQSTDNNEPFVSDYKGNPVFNIPLKDGKTFCFGIGKAYKILANIDGIQAFVDEYGNRKKQQ